MDPFLKACGATGRLRWSMERQSPSAVEVVDLDQPYALIGRDARADLRLDHPVVGERHAYAQVVDGRLFCVDLGSRQGMSLGGTRQRSAWVDLGQAVRIGPYRVRLVAGIAEEADDATSAGEIEKGPESRLVLELSHRGVRSSLCRIHSTLVLVGSAADCQVRLLDPSVANYHCSLLHTPAGAWVVDLLGERGVTVNGVAESCARVDDGDEIRVGHSVIRLWREAAPSRGIHRIVGNGHAPNESHDTADALTGPRDATADEPAVAGDGSPGEGAEHETSGPTARPTVPALTEAASAIGQVPALRKLLEGQTPEGAALVESIVVPLVEHFGRMQQGMFEEFRDARDAMFQMCAEIQREQADTIERELDQIRGVARELETLREDLADRLRAFDRRVDTAMDEGPPRVMVRLGTATPLSPRNGSGRSRRGNHRLDRITGQGTVALTVRETSGDGPAGALAGDGAGLGSCEPGFGLLGKDERPPHEDIHAVLCERMQSVRREQRSRWRRIFDRVQGPFQVGSAR